MQSATGRFLLSLASGRTLHKVLFVIRAGQRFAIETFEEL
jgi:hypothetical protein